MLDVRVGHSIMVRGFSSFHVRCECWAFLMSRSDVSVGRAFLMSRLDVSVGHAFLISRLDVSAGKRPTLWIGLQPT